MPMLKRCWISTLTRDILEGRLPWKLVQPVIFQGASADFRQGEVHFLKTALGACSSNFSEPPKDKFCETRVDTYGFDPNEADPPYPFSPAVALWGKWQ